MHQALLSASQPRKARHPRRHEGYDHASGRMAAAFLPVSYTTVPAARLPSHAGFLRGRLSR
ncbi:hypothetical protein EV669_10880 [Gulbenkiania mobilis]|uniref:Uncharacterized protein n=1 Tax=Gulbenkiania mobilis TaxID=397457 RepID=A0ABY2CZN6_GULMO|nr:hypothetical protein EV669_10880 [Gulbenkiania mobilis]